MPPSLPAHRPAHRAALLAVALRVVIAGLAWLPAHAHACSKNSNVKALMHGKWAEAFIVDIKGPIFFVRFASEPELCTEQSTREKDFAASKCQLTASQVRKDKQMCDGRVYDASKSLLGAADGAGVPNDASDAAGPGFQFSESCTFGCSIAIIIVSSVLALCCFCCIVVYRSGSEETDNRGNGRLSRLATGLKRSSSRFTAGLSFKSRASFRMMPSIKKNKKKKQLARVHAANNPGAGAGKQFAFSDEGA